jgi:peptide deformylase
MTAERILPCIIPTRPMAMIGGRDERLRIKSVALDLNDPKVHDEVTKLAARMLATLLRTPVAGLALAAPQVGVNVRLVVTNQGVAYANPIITVQADHDGVETGIEGCRY